jgi:hypothetical protein
MKRKLFLVLALAALITLPSCVREEDWDLLKHPIHVTASVDPNIGAPIASGQLSFNDILHMLSSTYTGIVDPNADIITIHFDTVMTDTIRHLADTNYSSSLIPPFKTGKAATIIKDTTITYGLDITLFDNIEIEDLVAGNIEIGSLLLNVNSFIKADCPDSVIVGVRRYVSAAINNFTINYTDHNGNNQVFTTFSNEQIPVDSLLVGFHYNRTDIELRDIINEMPRHIEVSYRFHFELDGAFFSDPECLNMYNGMRQFFVFYNADVRADFPLDIRIGSIPYNFTINFAGDSLPHIDIDHIIDSMVQGFGLNAEHDVYLKESQLKFAFENNIPLNLDMAAYLLDEHDSLIGDTLIRHGIQSAACRPVGGFSTSYESERPYTTRLDVPLDTMRYSQFRQTSKIGFKLRVATGDANAAGRTVAIRRDDYLKIKVYAQLHPSAFVNVRVTNQGLIK